MLRKNSEKCNIYLILIKILNKVGRAGTFLNITKGIYKKSAVNIILNGERQYFSPQVRNWARISMLTTYGLHYSGGLLQHNHTKKNKDIQGMGEVRLSLFRDDMIVYIEHPKESIKKLLEVICEFKKISG